MDRSAAPTVSLLPDAETRGRGAHRPAAPFDANADGAARLRACRAGRHQGNLGCVPGAPQHRLLCRSCARTARQVGRRRRQGGNTHDTICTDPASGARARTHRAGSHHELGDTGGSSGGGQATSDQSETAKMLHAELRRLGCYPGAVDASWGSGSRRALELFNKHAGQRSTRRLPVSTRLASCARKTTRVCPLECKSGYRAENDACVKIVCRAGFVLGDDGDCERKPKAKTASRPEPREPASRSAPRRQQYGGPAPSPTGSRSSNCIGVDRHSILPEQRVGC